MWILECDGDILNNKRVWLRPGKTYLFGRTKPETSRDQTGFRINHKTVSRKHLIITVASTGPETVGQVGQRSALTFEDAGTKAGTKIDGERVYAGNRVDLTGPEHTFTLSSYEHSFRVTWKAVVISFTFSSKDTKGGKEPLQQLHARLAGFDIKAIANYAATKTTHVVASKRNTARGLQALIHGARIVTDDFVEALVSAATPTDLDAPESFAPLEEDFDAAWPEDSAFLPPPGREPGPKDAELFEPDPQRIDVFRDMIFVFCDLRQFENLQPPITDGGGRAILFNLIPEQTKPAELHQYVKNLSGEKDSGLLSEDSQVVMVKFGAPRGYEEWAEQLQADVGSSLGCRLMEQNEFLDAILTNDAGKLRKRAPLSSHAIDSSGSDISHTKNSSAHSSVRADIVAEEKPSSSARRARGKVTPLFKGFDEGFNPNDIEYTSKKGQTAANNLSAPDEGTTTSTSEQDQIAGSRKSTHSRALPRGKRRAPAEDSLEEIEASMFPGAAVMKRRKLEEGDMTDQHPGPENLFDSGNRTVTSVDARKEKGRKQEANISALVRARREAFDAKAEEATDGMAGLEEMTVSQMKSLAVVEELQLSTREPLAEAQDHVHNGRWRDEWNGRKNFKRFRRQGDGKPTQQFQSVIVPLEEAIGGESGLGHGYWPSRTSNATSRYRQRIRAGWDDDVHEDSEQEAGDSNGLVTQRSKGSKTSAIDGIPDTSNGNQPEDEALLGSGGAGQLNGSNENSNSRSNIASAGHSQSSKSQAAGLNKRARVSTQSSSDGRATASTSKRQRRFDSFAGGFGSKSNRAGRYGAIGSAEIGDSESDSEAELKFRYRKRTEATG